MSEIDEVLKANEDFARRFTLWYLSKRPKRRLAVLTCMDARLSVEQALGLAPGEAHIMRNAGAIASEDALRSLVLSHHELGTREIMIIGHTECGTLGLNDRELRARLEGQFGPAEAASHLPRVRRPRKQHPRADGESELAPLAAWARRGARICLRRQDGSPTRGQR